MTGGIQELSINLNDNVIVSPSTATFKDIIWSETIGEDENGNPLDNGTAKLNGNTLTVYEGGTYYVTATVKDGDLLNGKDKSQDFEIKVEVAPIGEITVDNNKTPALAGNGYYYAGQKVSLTMDASILAKYGSDIEWDVDGDKTLGTSDGFTFTIPADFTKNSITVTATNTKIADSGKQTITLNVKPFTEISDTDITITKPTTDLKHGETFTLKATTTAPQQTTVIWELSGNDSSTTLDSTSGLLTIGEQEDHTSISVTATLEGAKLNADKNALESVSKTETIGIDLGTVDTIFVTTEKPDGLPTDTFYQGQKVTLTTNNRDNNIEWKIINESEWKLPATQEIPKIVGSGDKDKNKTAVLTIPSDFPTTYKITVQAKVGTTTITKDINVAEFKPVKDFSIAGTDGATSVEKGDSLQLISTIDPAQPSVNNGITWKITTSGIKTGTKIDENGNLTIAADETKTSITVQATLTTATITSGVLKDSSKSSNKLTVTITTPPNSDTSTKAATSSSFSLRNENTNQTSSANNSLTKPATGIKLSGATSVEKGDSVQIKATVTPTNASNKDDIKWTISGNNKSGTTISSNGLLTVADNETAKTITVKATIGKVSNTIKITVKTPTVPERTNRELPNEAKDAISGGSRYPNKTVVRAD